MSRVRAILHRARYFLRVNFVNKHWISVQRTVCETESFRFSCSSEKPNRDTSMQFLSRLRSNSKTRWDFQCDFRQKMHRIAATKIACVNGQGLSIWFPSNCLSHKMFTSSSVIASAASGLFPRLPSFLRAAKPCLTCSNWLSQFNKDICRLSSAD